MPQKEPAPTHSKEKLKQAIEKESQQFQEYYEWVEKHMPHSFFEDVDQENIIPLIHSLMHFDLTDFFSSIHLKTSAFTLCLDNPDADLRVLERYQSYGIKNYRSFVSNAPPPFPGVTAHLRIARILFSHFEEKKEPELLPLEKEKELFKNIKLRNPSVTESALHALLEQLGPLFLRSLTKDRLILALDMFFRAKTRDNCQYEVRYNEDWKEKKETPSVQIVFAWRNVPKYQFLYRMAEMIHRHGLSLKRVNAIYIDPYSQQNVLVMSLAIHGMKGGAAWEEADLPDFLKELVTLKYFEGMEMIEEAFVSSRLLTGNQGNLLKSIAYFVHQSLLHVDVNMYSLQHIEEGLCRHPELVIKLITAFNAKFHPDYVDQKKYQAIKEEYLALVEQLDTGHPLNDTRRKNVLKQAMFMVEFTLKTNVFRNNKTAFCFRLDPVYLEHLPFDRKDKFPELPYAIFFMKGLYFLGFHIRFRDLSRGGLRTVFPEKMEQMLIERNNVFAECYQLAYTQNKKNKDIPEGGAKGVIFLEPYERLQAEASIYEKELKENLFSAEEIATKLSLFHTEQKLEYLHQTQRSYVESFLTLLNCDPNGALRAKHIIDYWKRPEYVYLGPDENMHNEMIEWIASYSKHYGYKPGGAFISSKPGAGINHKEFGVTSLGVNVYMEEILKFLNINPQEQPFSVKMTGGPDGDVAGNQMFNLFHFYPNTAQLVATTDISGTIYDPAGLDLKTINALFREGRPIRFYPPEQLHEGGFLLDARTKREHTAYAFQTACYKKYQGKIVEEWLLGNEMNHLLRHNVHKTKADIFIPGGGRPRTLNENNFKDFLDEGGQPTAKAIVEGANLYLTPWARRALEKLGVLIIKDSSANKGGVICSSFEVLFSLALSEEEFLKEKPQIVTEILQIIEKRAREEALTILKTYEKTHAYLTDISELISEKINLYKDELIAYLQTVPLSQDPEDPLIRCLLNYCPPLLKTKYQDRILNEVPDVHKKAIIACHIASRLVYFRGVDWHPTLVDILPIVAIDPVVVGSD